MHSVRLCEVTEQKKMGEEDKEMIDEDKKKMVTRLDKERINEVKRLTHNQFDMVNQLLSANHEIIRKVEEIEDPRLENNKFKNELR